VGEEAEDLAEVEAVPSQLLGRLHRGLQKSHPRSLQALLNNLLSLLLQHQHLLFLQLHQLLPPQLNKGYLMRYRNVRNRLLCVNMGSNVPMLIAGILILRPLLLPKVVLFSVMKLARREKTVKTKIASKPTSALLLYTHQPSKHRRQRPRML